MKKLQLTLPRLYDARELRQGLDRLRQHRADVADEFAYDHLSFG